MDSSTVSTILMENVSTKYVSMTLQTGDYLHISSSINGYLSVLFHTIDDTKVLTSLTSSDSPQIQPFYTKKSAQGGFSIHAIETTNVIFTLFLLPMILNSAVYVCNTASAEIRSDSEFWRKYEPTAILFGPDGDTSIGIIQNSLVFSALSNSTTTQYFSNFIKIHSDYPTALSYSTTTANGGNFVLNFTSNSTNSPNKRMCQILSLGPNDQNETPSLRAFYFLILCIVVVAGCALVLFLLHKWLKKERSPTNTTFTEPTRFFDDYVIPRQPTEFDDGAKSEGSMSSIAESFKSFWVDMKDVYHLAGNKNNENLDLQIKTKPKRSDKDPYFISDQSDCFL